MKRLAILLSACSPTPQPATVSVAASASASAPVTAAATASAFDLGTCGMAPGCKWSVGYRGACSGAAVVRGPVAAPTPVCVCNGCLSDADCTAKPGGKCENFTQMCNPSAKACTYPGDLCSNGGQACEKTMYTRPGGSPEHKACYHDGMGHAACGPFQWPPP